MEARAAAEENRIGLPGLRQLRKAIAALWSEAIDTVTGEAVVSGAIPTFNAAVFRLLTAIDKETEERGKAANTAFQALWEAAQPFFAGGVLGPDVCPICATPIPSTTAGSAEGIRVHITRHLEELADYAGAREFWTTQELLRNHCPHSTALAALPASIALLSDDDVALNADFTKYQTSIASWSKDANSDHIVAVINKKLAALDDAITDLELKQGEHTYAKAKKKIDLLLKLQVERDIALRTLGELAKLSDALTAQAVMISAEIRKKIQALLDKVQTPMNQIYKLIQGTGATSIRLELPTEEDTNQQRLNLLINFAKNRTGAQPSGYLSDSQIHSLALALRLAAIKQFNRTAPVIALDDIVTSYDAPIIAAPLLALSRPCSRAAKFS